jgi:hypothetical protein
VQLSEEAYAETKEGDDEEEESRVKEEHPWETGS